MLRARVAELEKQAAARPAEGGVQQRDVLRGLLEHVPNVAVRSCGPDGTIRYWNRGCERLYGYTAAEAVGADAVELLVAPEDRDEARRALSRTAATGEAGEGRQLQFIRKDGTRVRAWCSEVVVPTAGGQAEVFCLSVDLTAQERADEELEASRRRFRSLVETMTEGLTVIDKDDVLTFVNDRFCEQTGYAREELIGRHVWELFDEANRAALRAQLEARRKGASRPYEIAWTRKDGSLLPTIISPRAIVDAEGGYGGSFAVVTDISDQKRAEEGLHESEQRLRSLVEDLVAAVLIHDRDGRYAFVNRMAREMLGYEHGELLSRGIRDITVGFDEGCYEKILADLEQRKMLSIEVASYRRRDGSAFPVELYLAPIEWDGRPCILNVAHDITDRRKAEELLEASEERLRTLVEDLTAAVFIHDREGRHVFVNRLGRRMLGYTEDELLSRGVRDIMVDFDEGSYRQVLGYVREQKSTLIEATYRRKDGSTFPSEVHLGPVWWGGAECIVSVVHDVTERRQAADALRQQRDFAESLIENANVFVVLTDMDGLVLRLNSFALERTGHDLDEVAGKGWSESFWPADQQEQLAQWFGEVRAGRSVREVESKLQAKDGRAVLVRWSLSPLKDAGGAVVAILAVGSDVTVMRHREAQLRDAQRMKTVGHLAGGIAHHFNNLLTVIIGNTELLKMELAGQPAKMSLTDQVLRASSQAAELTAQLLAYARRGKYQIVPVDLNETVERVANLLRADIGPDVRITLDLCAEPCIVTGDPSQLREALHHLGLNARDAMLEGGELTFATETLTLTPAEADEATENISPGRYVKVSVSDTGVGMDAEVRDNLFDPFYTTKRVGEGTGLGLAGVYGCVKNHYGAARVRSDPGRGTTIELLLPLADRGTAFEPDPGPDEGCVDGKGTVLVVDDEANVCSLVARVLGRRGYEVAICTDGAEAVRTYRERPGEFDLVILDLIMPGLDGREAFHEMKRIDPDVRVVVSSGFSRDDLPHELLAEGVLSFLAKPYQIEELVEVVDRYVGH